MIDYYEVLGVSVDATAPDIANAYRKLRGIHHPDHGGDAEQFNRVREAFDVLSDPMRRKEYDRNEGEGQYRRAIKKLQTNMIDMIENTPHIDGVDYVETMKQNINVYIHALNSITDELKSTIDKYTVVSGKIKTKSKGAKNIFTIAIDEKIAEITRRVNQIKDDTEVAGMMIEILEYYKCDIQLLLGVYQNDFKRHTKGNIQGAENMP